MTLPATIRATRSRILAARALAAAVPTCCDCGVPLYPHEDGLCGDCDLAAWVPVQIDAPILDVDESQPDDIGPDPIPAPVRDLAAMPHRREFPMQFWLPRRLVVAFIAHGWRDTSYRHDACPTFERDGTAVFCDVHDHRRRELGGGGFKRFQIVSPLAIDVNNFETTDALIDWLRTS